MDLQLVSYPTASVSLSGEFAGTQARLDGVNWNSEVALVIDLGEKRTGGYSVAVTDIRQRESGQVEVTVALAEPAPGDFVMQVITHPYAVTPLPRTYLAQGPVTVTVKDQHGRERARQVLEA